MTKIKICGITRLEDVETVNKFLPDYVGFVFTEKSKRHVSPRAAMELKEKLDPRIKTTGVFVNREIHYIASIINGGIVDIVQLHGDENDDFIVRLRGSCEQDFSVIKAIAVSDSGEIPPFPGNADYLLFDRLSVQRGGSGKAFDWKALNGFNAKPYFLAGGLTPDNVAEAVALLNPYCVDVSTGVETNGVKDSKKIETFIQNARRNAT